MELEVYILVDLEEMKWGIMISDFCFFNVIRREIELRKRE